METNTVNENNLQEKTSKDDAREQQLRIDKEASEEKRRIYARLKAYRKVRGLGCFKEISEATGGKIAIGTIANMYTGTKVTTVIWQQIGDALEKLADV